MYTVLHQQGFPEPLGSQLDDFYRQIKLEEVKERYIHSSAGQKAKVRRFVEANEQKLRGSAVGRELVEFIQNQKV